MAIPCARANPFRDCADPGSAIPSSACNRAFAALEHAILAEQSPIVLLGPVGAGKTLLLRRIVDRPPPSIRTIFVPWLNVPAEDVIPWIRAFEGAQASEDDFVAAARAFHARGVRTLLLVDEAQSMPRESAARLAELVSGAGNAVQVLLAGMEGSSLQAAAAAFHGAEAYVELKGEVTPPEVAAWAHSTFNADELSRLRELDWAELVRKARGIPRLVRWELERRLATGDLAAALRQGTPEALEGRVAPVQSAKRLEVVLLPTVRASPQAPVARSADGMRLDAALYEARILLVRITEELRRISFRGRAATREAVDTGRCSARLLGQVFRQTANQIRDAAAPHTERAAAFMADWSAGASARGRRALSDARSWSAQRSARIALTTRIAFTEASRRSASTLREFVSRTQRTTETLALAVTAFTARRVPAIREAAGRGAERAFELVRVSRRALLSELRGSKRFRQMSEMRAGPLAVFALVAGVAFLLGRMSALPNAAGRAHAPPPPAPAVVSSGPPREVGQDQTIAPQPREGAKSAQNGQEAGPSPPLSSPPAHPENAPRTAPKHILVKIDSHPRARIWIDGHDVGRTPLARVPLTPGRHNFQVLFANGRKIHRIVEIRHGTHVVKFS